jgi:multiple antibiotic resistance protein
MFDTAEYVKLIVALVAIIDVPGNVPVYLQQTGQLSPAGRRLTAVVASVATAAILLCFALVGEQILQSFGISIAAFKMLGGIVVLLIALDMLGLTGSETPENTRAVGDNPVTIGVFPLAVPLFAGPGAITAVMVYAHEDFHTQAGMHDVLVVAVILTAAVVMLVGLLMASALGRLIGPVTQVVLNRLLGMIVGALGVEFILEGVAEFFPTLAGAG